ncbi:MAG: DUF6797 domain-containing protein [Verrucomicrobiales bacterium]
MKLLLISIGGYGMVGMELCGALPKGAMPLPTANRPPSWSESVENGVITAGGGDWVVGGSLGDARVHLEYWRPSDGATGRLHFEHGLEVALDGGAGSWQALDVATERLPGKAGLVRVWRDGREVVRSEISKRGAVASPGARFVSSVEQARSVFRFDGDFSLVARFRTTGGGTLASLAPAEGPWAPNAKALFVRGGRLVYDIGWLGAYSAGPPIDDGAWHTVALVLSDGRTTMHLDGTPLPSRDGFTKPDVPTHVFKIGAAAPDFAGDFTGELAAVRFYQRALSAKEIRSLTNLDSKESNTPDFAWEPADGASKEAPALRIAASAGMQFRNVWSQPLDRTDHAALIRGWNEASLERGSRIYHQLCVVCHGTVETPGSLPTALRFGEAPFKNGDDPISIYRTLTDGFGQMVAQPQYTARQKYDVIHYIRETFLRRNAAYDTATDATYLAGLPVGLATAELENEVEREPPYRQMDFGPALLWTLQAAEGNIAQKGIAVRLDAGSGGISRGKDWMLYDHDTLRVATGWSGEGFVDWKGIAFDGSHQTHTSISGTPVYANPTGPGWANPSDGSWDDPRPQGRDGRRYGPLPRAWARYRGLYLHGDQAVVSYTVGTADVLDSPSLIPYGAASVFVRTLNLGASTLPLTARLATDDPAVGVVLRGAGARLDRQNGFVHLHFPPADHPRHVRVYLARLDAPNLQALADADGESFDLAPLTRGGPPRWGQEITTRVTPGDDAGALRVDTLPLPDANPWRAWMRTTGFDFYPDGKSAAVCTWNGDVWRVDGIDGDGELRWRRLASGLFQPLGLKFRGGDLFVSCRDQLARLHDLNGDGETDFVECFNNDHQVTEHFHEFAMGLQTDTEGNFYYAKSARHALPALVPHHGTLLRVSADGERTDIIAHGFRAANGVCLNDDGTFFVTDQEGHWTPKNRINHVIPDGGFYGNLFGYTEVTDPDDGAMRPPLVWITNQHDRSPAELVSVPKGVWGPLAGSLLNLSYGYGRLYVVPHESVNGQLQGGVCALPLPDFPTGVMRGRFHPNGFLYACGMVGWATNCQQDGGFYRLRPTGRPLRVPIKVSSRPGSLTLTFSDPLPMGVDTSTITARAWNLRRSAHYGSPHLDERPLQITSATVDADRRTLTLSLPDLAPTPGLEIAWRLPDAEEGEITGSIHLSLQALGSAETTKN